MFSSYTFIEIKKNPIGDGNCFPCGSVGGFKNYRNKKEPHRGRKQDKDFVKAKELYNDRNKKEPHRGRKPNTRESIIPVAYIEIKKNPIGDGNAKF